MPWKERRNYPAIPELSEFQWEESSMGLLLFYSKRREAIDVDSEKYEISQERKEKNVTRFYRIVTISMGNIVRETIIVLK